MTAHAIATKYRRALRNRTGATFTLEQLQELASYGVLEFIARIETQELCPAKPARALSENTGLIGGATVVRPKFGRSPEPSNDLSYIAALTANA